jgi:hypothetical protein
LIGTIRRRHYAELDHTGGTDDKDAIYKHRRTDVCRLVIMFVFTAPSVPVDLPTTTDVPNPSDEGSPLDAQKFPSDL